MTIGLAHLQPIVSLIAGILILIMPQLLNYIVAIFLIISGILVSLRSGPPFQNRGKCDAAQLSRLYQRG
jgi:hypothetical protein